MNKKGFTTIELAVGGAIMIIILLGVVTLTSNSYSAYYKMSNSVDNTSLQLIFGRVLMGDISQSSPSFDVLINQPDDNNNNFFDYIPDYPITLTDPGRTLTLSLTGTKRSFYMLVQDSSQAPLMLYDPIAAYAVGTAPSNLSQAASLTYTGVNTKSVVSSQRAFWTSGRLLMLDAAVLLRPIPLVLSQTPVAPAFIGAVSGTDLVADSWISGMSNHLNPLNNANFSTADSFFRNLPAVGGSTPIVRLRPVLIIKYYLDADPSAPGSARIWRSTYTGGGTFATGVLLATGVKNLILTRSSIKDRYIFYQIN